MPGRTGRIGKRFSIAFLAAVAFAASALASAPTAAAGTLDQQQTEFGTLTAGIGTVSVAQTFTAGVGGVLDQVDLVLDKNGIPPAPLTVEIQSVTGGCPSTTVLSSETVAAADLPSDPAWISIPFASPAQVVAGMQYATVLYTAPGGGSTYTASGVATDAYPTGQRCSSTVPPSTWSAAGTGDLAFKTYVAVPPLPPPPPPAVTASCSGLTATQVGTAGNDVITGTPGADVIAALAGNDKVSGLSGKDLICGGTGNDKLNGGKGKDALLGQAGRDMLKGGGGNDTCKGGKGKDTLSSC